LTESPTSGGLAPRSCITRDQITGVSPPAGEETWNRQPRKKQLTKPRYKKGKAAQKADRSKILGQKVVSGEEKGWFTTSPIPKPKGKKKEISTKKDYYNVKKINQGGGGGGQGKEEARTTPKEKRIYKASGRKGGEGNEVGEKVRDVERGCAVVEV